MPKETTLTDTFREVVAETEIPAQSGVKETDKGLSQAASDETKSGETPEKEYVSGVDISDIPEVDRPRIREKLSQKSKLLEDGYNKKFQEVSKLKKAQDELTALGLTTDEARDVLARHIEQKRNPVQTTAEKGKAVRLLDKLIETAPLEQRSSLEQMRQIILEETSVPEIQKDLAEIKKFIGSFANDANARRQNELNGELDSLKGKYGALVDTYRDDVLRQGLQYKANARQLLHAIVPPDELEQAIANSVKPGKTLTKEKANAISSPASGITSSLEHVDTKKVSMKNLLSEILVKK